jgi:rhamnosyltransferase
MKTAAVISWYEPLPAYVDNLRTYANSVDRVIVVDDTGADHSELLADFPEVTYVCFDSNKGIASALNAGYSAAQSFGAEWVLTMDQDSSWRPSELSRFMAAAHVLSLDKNVAIVAPNFTGSFIAIPPDGGVGQADCDGVISAGSFVRLKSFRDIGGYNEELFIDQVDHEFSYRLRKRGFRIVRLTGVEMNHEVGMPLRRRIFGRNIVAGGHSAARKYYMVRNSLYMRSSFGEFGAPYLEMIFMMALGVIFLEDKKLSKLAHMVKGAWHYLVGVTGKLVR